MLVVDSCGRLSKGRARYKKIPKISTGIYIAGSGKSIGYRGAETPVTPDEPDGGECSHLIARDIFIMLQSHAAAVRV
jgi:hypothetical protein